MNSKGVSEKEVIAINECKLPLSVSIAFKHDAASDWTILTTVLQPGQKQLFEPTPADGTYYYVKSTDGSVVWGASKDGTTAKIIVINGKVEEIGFSKLVKSSEGMNTNLILRCH